MEGVDGTGEEWKEEIGGRKRLRESGDRSREGCRER